MFCNFQNISVVATFDIKNAKGKKVYIYDHLETRVDHDDLLKFLLKSNPENLILKVQFVNERRSIGGELITSMVTVQEVSKC